MTRPISTELASIINLHQAAICHKKDCKNSDCSVSLYHLKLAAINLQRQLVLSEEFEEATRLVDDWPR